MNSEIEQRIVAMYFDNKDFEKNAQQTINTLGNLKNSLDLEDAAKGFDELDKAGKKLNLNQARTTINNFKNAASGITGILKKAFDIGTAPLHALDNFFGTFRSYVGKFVGFDLAGKFVNSLESAIQQLTVAPIQAGWNMYQANIDSTKTIMSGTLKSYKEEMEKNNTDWTYNEEEHMEFVKKNLRELSEYAQKTVFSLSDMTSNVGKFTNNNIDLETSVTAMEGIANMTAKAGQGAQQASMAMYNFSQALGVGKMTTIDWKSIENANLATTELKDLFIQTAEAAGKLEKVVTTTADGKKLDQFFITVDKNGKKLAKNKWIEVSAENFRDSLSNGWLDKETMLRVMQLYSNQINDVDTLEAWGFDVHDEELVKYLFSIGEEAEKAATQVRTFSKMWDALTESVQSSWADSMQYIFGDMLEATDFWTEVNNKIGSVLDSAGERRNNLLREWRGMSFDEDTGEWKKIEGAVDGREDLIQGIYNTIEAAKDLGRAFSAAWQDVFGNLTGKRLQEITAGFRDFIERFREWLGDMNNVNSRISKIRAGLGGVFSVLKVIGEAAKTLFGVAKKVVTPLIDPLLNLFDKFGKFMKLDGAKNLGEALAMLRDRFNSLWNRISGLGWSGMLGKIGGWLGNLWTQIREGIHSVLDESGLSPVFDWFVSIGDRLKEGYETVKTWWEGSGITEFFAGIWESVTGLFKPKTGMRYNGSMLEEYTEDAPIITFFYKIRDGVSTAFETVKTWWEGSGIPKFFEDLWESVTGIFKQKTGMRYNGSMLEEYTEDAPIVSFFYRIRDGISSAYETVKTWWEGSGIPRFFEDLWESVTGLFKPKTGMRYNGSMLEEYAEDAPIVAFFYRIRDGLANAFESVRTWWEGSGVPEFFTGIWESVTSIFKPKTGMRYNGSMLEEYTEEMPIVTFFNDMWKGVQDVWGKVSGWFVESGITEFLSNIWDWIETQAGAVIDWFSKPVEEGKTGFVLFLEEFAASVSSIWTTITNWSGWAEIGKFFGNIWGYITSFFSGGADIAESTADIANAANEVKGAQAPTEETVGLLERIVNAVTGFVQTVVEKVNGLVIPPEVNTFFVNMGDFLQGIMTFVSDILGKAGRVAMGKGDFLNDWLPLLVIGIVGIVAKIIDVINNKNLSGIQIESAASKFMSIGVGLLAIAAAISLLTTVDTGKMLLAAGVMAVLGVVLAKIVQTVSNTTDSLTKLTEAKSTKITGVERIINNLIDGLEKVGMIAVAMALLPEVIRAFGEAKKTSPELAGKDIMDTLLGLTAMIIGISAVLTILDKVTNHAGLDPAAALKTGLAIAAFFGSLTTGFAVIGGAIGIGASLSDQIQGVAAGSSAKSVQKSLSDAGDTIKSVMSLGRSFVEGLFGIETDKDKIGNAQEILTGLAQQLEVFTSEKTSGLLRVLNLIGTLSQVVQNTPDADKISSFADSLAPLADGIAKFSFVMSGFTDENMQDFAYWNPDNLEDQVQKVEGVFRALGHINGNLSQTHAEQFLNGIRYLNENMNAEDFQAFGHIVNGIVQSFDAAVQTDSGPMADMADSLMTNLSKAIKLGLSSNNLDALGAFDATPIVDSIVTAIGFGETAIATAVHNMVQAGLDKSENPGNGEGGYEFDPMQLWSGGLGGLMGFINNPEQVFGFSGSADGLTDYLYGKGGTKEHPADDSVLGVMNGFAGSLENYEVPDISSTFANVFSFKDPKTGEDLDIVGQLRETLDGIQEEINNLPEFEIKIVPTFDLQKLDAEVLRQALGNRPIMLPMGAQAMGGNVSFDMSGFITALDLNSIRTRLDNIRSSIDVGQSNIVVAIQNMEGSIGGICSAISSIRLMLDTGVLVGALAPLIDVELGKRAATARTTGVSSMLGNPYARTKAIPLTE